MNSILSPITTHVLDIAQGRPARGIAVRVEIARDPGQWTELAHGVTDDDGRIGLFDPPLVPLERGVYRLVFATGAYFEGQGVRGFYPEVCVTVQIDEPAQHYHIPMLLSPFGYSTYRGR
jgi:5-hydroxyisourate hydrolase